MPKGIRGRKVCAAAGCGYPVSTQGHCGAHAWRVAHWGDARPDVPIMARLTETERFWIKVDKNGPISEHRPDLGSCWIWTASKKDGGYGQMQWKGRLEGAHRIAYMLMVGPITDGFDLDHLCRVPPCVRPLHLEAVTHRENLLRGESPMAQGARRTHCSHGHEYTPKTLQMYRKPNGRWTRRCRICQHAWDRGLNPDDL